MYILSIQSLRIRGKGIWDGESKQCYWKYWVCNCTIYYCGVFMWYLVGVIVVALFIQYGIFNRSHFVSQGFSVPMQNFALITISAMWPVFVVGFLYWIVSGMIKEGRAKK